MKRRQHNKIVKATIEGKPLKWNGRTTQTVWDRYHREIFRNLRSIEKFMKSYWSVPATGAKE